MPFSLALINSLTILLLPSSSLAPVKFPTNSDKSDLRSITVLSLKSITSPVGVFLFI